MAKIEQRLLNQLWHAILYTKACQAIAPFFIPIILIRSLEHFQSVLYRPEGCTIEENSEMILPYDLVEDHLEEKEILRVREAEEASGWTQTEYLPVSQANSLSQEEEEGTNVPRDPIDALNDDDREYDETFEDTPEVDQGY